MPKPYALQRACIYSGAVPFSGRTPPSCHTQWRTASSESVGCWYDFRFCLRTSTSGSRQLNGPTESPAGPAAKSPSLHGRGCTAAVLLPQARRPTGRRPRQTAAATYRKLGSGWACAPLPQLGPIGPAGRGGSAWRCATQAGGLAWARRARAAGCLPVCGHPAGEIGAAHGCRARSQTPARLAALGRSSQARLRDGARGQRSEGTLPSRAGPSHFRVCRRTRDSAAAHGRRRVLVGCRRPTSPPARRPLCQSGSIPHAKRRERGDQETIEGGRVAEQWPRWGRGQAAQACRAAQASTAAECVGARARGLRRRRGGRPLRTSGRVVRSGSTGSDVPGWGGPGPDSAAPARLSFQRPSIQRRLLVGAWWGQNKG